jgi:hypothetical protein
MRLEIESAVNFLINVIRFSNLGISESQLLLLNKLLQTNLYSKFENKWDKSNYKNFQSDRVIKIKTSIDNKIKKAFLDAIIPSNVILNIFFEGIKIYINPGEVIYKVGSDIKFHTLFHYISPPIPWEPTLQQNKMVRTNLIQSEIDFWYRQNKQLTNAVLTYYNKNHRVTEYSCRPLF